ncbi:heavy metal-associated isoprenylated plant protein 47-like [Quercus lobata]|uniref:heavy metal-associated isoprenylated plant protein 47-like n=1 Tax=Quercus lobata TaxID=97700 RepID=UPI001244DEBC|nr:heavy metal-associated isoprenylated plant protein 47-like [Quercus lobata]
MKQKIVIKVQMNCDKCTRKAMKIACKANGVNSVAIEGSDRDQLVVIGEGVDSANLTCSLRKKLCYAALWSVDEVKANKKPEEKPKPEVQKPNKPESTSSTCYCGCPQLPICPQYAPYPMLYESRVYDYTPSPSYCPIM